MVTQFSGDMFRDDSSSSMNLSPQKMSSKGADLPGKGNGFFYLAILFSRLTLILWFVQTGNLQQLAEKLQLEIRGIQARRQAQETELASIDNAALRQRFQGALDQLIMEEHEKREEVCLQLFFLTSILLIFFFVYFQYDQVISML